MRTEQSTGSDQARSVQTMFTEIAPRYDLMNRLMTWGQDIQWRKAVIRLASPPVGGTILDLGAGTGDLAREAVRQFPGCRVTAADFTLQMMLVGKNRLYSPEGWTGADALYLPFRCNSFDAVVSGFLLRNVIDLDNALAEQYRVLKPGGRLVTLDTTHPKKNFFSPLIRFHMRHVIPFLGGALTGARDAYVYLPSTSEGFLTAEKLRSRILAAGFVQVGFKRHMFGTIAIHWAQKPGPI